MGNHTEIIDLPVEYSFYSSIANAVRVGDTVVSSCSKKLREEHC